MSISHWGMFFGFMVAEEVKWSPGTYNAVWRACSPDEWVSW